MQPPESELSPELPLLEAPPEPACALALPAAPVELAPPVLEGEPPLLEAPPAPLLVPAVLLDGPPATELAPPLLAPAAVEPPFGAAVPPCPALFAPPALAPPLLVPPLLAPPLLAPPLCAPPELLPPVPVAPPADVPPAPPVPGFVPSATNWKSRITTSTFFPSEGGASKHHKLMPSGSACCGMFVVGFAGE